MVHVQDDVEAPVMRLLAHDRLVPLSAEAIYELHPVEPGEAYRRTLYHHPDKGWSIFMQLSDHFLSADGAYIAMAASGRTREILDELGDTPLTLYAVVGGHGRRGCVVAEKAPPGYHLHLRDPPKPKAVRALWADMEDSE